jgi:hypothetical protein
MINFYFRFPAASLFSLAEFFIPAPFTILKKSYPGAVKLLRVMFSWR